MMPKIAEFLEPTRPTKLVKISRKSKGLGTPDLTQVSLAYNEKKSNRAPEKIPHREHVNPDGDHIAFIRSAPAMELRRRYKTEAYAHTAMLNRRKQGATIHPDFSVFRSFLLHVGLMPGKGMTLDRIDNDDPEYAPGKVRWADKHTQNNNKSDTLTFYCSRTRVVYTTSRLAKFQKVTKDAIRKRRREGWSDDEIVEGKRIAPHPTPQPSKSSDDIPAPLDNSQQSSAKPNFADKKTLWAVGQVWQRQVSANCGNTELIPDWRILAYAKGVVFQIGFEKTYDLIQAVASAWPLFIDYVKSHDVVRDWPRHPSFEFVFRHHAQAALDFTYDKAMQAQRLREQRDRELIAEYRRTHGEKADIPALYQLRRDAQQREEKLEQELADKL